MTDKCANVFARCTLPPSPSLFTHLMLLNRDPLAKSTTKHCRPCIPQPRVMKSKHMHMERTTTKKKLVHQATDMMAEGLMWRLHTSPVNVSVLFRRMQKLTRPASATATETALHQHCSGSCTRSCVLQRRKRTHKLHSNAPTFLIEINDTFFVANTATAFYSRSARIVPVVRSSRLKLISLGARSPTNRSEMSH